MRYNEAVRELQFNRSRRFALAGEESFLKEYFEKIVQRALPASPVFIYYPEEEAEARSALFSLGLFENEKIVILKYFDQMKSPDFSELIREYPGYLLVHFSETANLKTTAASSIISLCTHVQCSKMAEYGSDYSIWLISQATEYGFSFVDGAEDLMYKKVGADMYTLSNELMKLMLYKKDEKTIIPEDVEKVVMDTAPASAYKILENILRKETVKALKSLDSYFRDNDDSVSLLGFLGHYMEKMYRLLLMKDQGISPDSMADILRLPSFTIKSLYLPRSMSFGKEKLSGCINKICELDVRLRTFRGDKKILFEDLIFHASV